MRSLLAQSRVGTLKTHVIADVGVENVPVNIFPIPLQLCIRPVKVFFHIRSVSIQYVAVFVLLRQTVVFHPAFNRLFEVIKSLIGFTDIKILPAEKFVVLSLIECVFTKIVFIKNSIEDVKAFFQKQYFFLICDRRYRRFLKEIAVGIDFHVKIPPLIENSMLFKYPSLLGITWIYLKPFRVLSV